MRMRAPENRSPVPLAGPRGKIPLGHRGEKFGARCCSGQCAGSGVKRSRFKSPLSHWDEILGVFVYSDVRLLSYVYSAERKHHLNQFGLFCLVNMHNTHI